MAQLARENCTGIVSDNVGMPMPGVSVLIKGTQSGTQTDLEGNFIKAATNQVLILVISA
jgi:hypothetical protein